MYRSLQSPLAVSFSRLWHLCPYWPMSAPAPTWLACRRAPLGNQYLQWHRQNWAEGYSCSFRRWWSRSASAHDRLARVAGSQFLTVVSALPLVSFLPSELKHTDLTTPECPLSDDLISPAAASTKKIFLL